MSHPSFRPCAECGASVKREELAEHECDAERKLDHQLVKLGPAIAAFDDALHTYLESTAGRFDVWYAEHRRRPLREG